MTGPRRAPGLPSIWELRAAWLFRGLILFAVIFHLGRGEFVYAIFSAAAVAFLAAPSLARGGAHANMPVEVELVILWGSVSDITLGRMIGLYEGTVWYDKVMHFGNAVLVGLLAFLIVFALRFMGRITLSERVMAGVILLFALGLGAAWEIVEYATNAVFKDGGQGNSYMSPFDDTMWDLIMDGMGGLVGAILGPLYMRFSKRTARRLEAIAAWIPKSPASHAKKRASGRS